VSRIGEMSPEQQAGALADFLISQLTKQLLGVHEKEMENLNTLNKRKQYRFVFALTALMILAGMTVLSGCSKSASAGSGAVETTELKYQGSVGSVTLPELAEDLGYLAPIRLKWVGNTISGPQDIQTAATGQTDFGGAFNGAIVNLIANGAKIKAVIGYYGDDADTWNGFYVLNDSPIRTAKDFIGKKVGMNTLGGQSEFVLKEYLKRNGLTDNEIKQVTLVVVPPVNTEQSLRQNQIDVAVLGGILLDKALEKGGIRSIFNDYELFGAFTGGSYIFTDKFIKNNPNTVKKFVEANAKAIEWARSTPRDQVIARFENIINKRGRNEDTSALKYWKSYGVAGKGGLIADNEFSLWIDWLVKSGQLKEGQIKAKDVYTNQYNPFQTAAQQGK
jgi:ABC-type nitrate/sulfonate/bicarbonate transport system substrate-binding protein